MGNFLASAKNKKLNLEMPKMIKKKPAEPPKGT
jgi:hypothetical protein